MASLTFGPILKSRMGPYKFHTIFLGSDITKYQVRIYNSSARMENSNFYVSLKNMGKDLLGPFDTPEKALLAVRMVGLKKLKELE